MCTKSRELRGNMPITCTLQQAAEESGLSLRTLQYAIKRGEITSVKVGRRRLVTFQSLEQFLSKGKRGPVNGRGEPAK